MPTEAHGPVQVLQHASCDHTTEVPSFLHPMGLDPEGEPAFGWYDPTPDDSLYKYDPSSAGRPLSAAMPMGGAVADLDGDGRLELLEATSTEHLLVFEDDPSGTFVDVTLDRGIVHAPAPTDDNPHGLSLPWGTVPVDLDLDGRLDVVMAMGDDFSSWRDGSLGPQPVAVHWNAGHGRFLDVTEDLGLVEHGSYRHLGLGDLDGDARPDLLVGPHGAPARMLVHRIDVEGHRGLALRLQGTTSNRFGLGAVVRVIPEGEAPASTQVMGGLASPEAQSEPVLFAGLGMADTATVEITWPSGVVQRVEGLAAETQHTLVEPALITLSEPSRHRLADGVSTITVQVTPRAMDGSLRSAAVQITSAWGSATFDGPETEVDVVWSRTLVAPTTPGSTVLEVVIDGEPSGIRPRVWWDPVGVDTGL